MAAASTLAPWRKLVRRNERPLILAWIAGMGAVLVGLWVWGIGLQGAERWIDRRSSAWVEELEAGRIALGSGDAAGAAETLERLEASLPPASIKTRWDADRKQLMSSLAEAYATLGRKGRALETLEALVTFDPLDLRSHAQHARTAETFGEGAVADAAWAEVLRLDPNHVEAVGARVIAAFEVGAWEDAVSTFEAFVEGHELAEATWVIRPAGSAEDQATRIEFDPRVLGVMEEHRIQVPVDGLSSGVLELQTGGHSIEIESLELVPAIRAGQARGANHPVNLAEASIQGGSSEHPGSLTATSHDASLVFEFAIEAPRVVAAIHLRARVFKTVDAEVLDAVGRSARNLIQEERFEALLPRIRVGGNLGPTPPSTR